MLTPPAASTPLRTSLKALVADDKAIGALFEDLLDRSHMTIPQLAATLGVTRQVLYQYRAGDRINPSIRFLLKLVAAAGGRILVELPTRALNEPGDEGEDQGYNRRLTI